MYKVDLPVDQSIKKDVERRRSAETARKARIFNTRLRVMGLDLNALNQQVQEKKHKQSMERQRDKAFGKLWVGWESQGGVRVKSTESQTSFTLAHN